MYRRSLSAFLFSWLLAVAVSAQIGPEIAQQHANRAGDRLAALKGLRAEGRILIGGETVSVVALAQRPGRLRVETNTPSRHVLQVTDGIHPPWISHTDTAGGAA